MAEITAALVKELREKSGAGMMDCKKALTATNGDIETAIDGIARQQGASGRDLGASAEAPVEPALEGEA